MIVKQLEDIVGTEHDVDTATWRSRLLVKKDGMGFSMHHTVIKAGPKLISGTRTMWKRFTVCRVKGK